MKNELRSISLLTCALFQPAAAIAQQPGLDQPPWGSPWHMWAWGPWWIFPIMVLAAVAVCAAFLLLRADGGRDRDDKLRGDPTASAMQILNERFARGDIARPEYEERKRALLTVMTPGGQA